VKNNFIKKRITTKSSDRWSAFAPNFDKLLLVSFLTADIMFRVKFCRISLFVTSVAGEAGGRSP